MLENTAKVGTTFQIEKFTEFGEITYQGEEFHNTVLLSGLALLYDNTLFAMTARLNLGSSNTPVDEAQTGLQDYKYSTSTVFNNQSFINFRHYPKCYVEKKVVFQFNVGTCTGTFRELGLSKDSNANYFNRQLIKDSNGNPMDLVVATTEGLRITVCARFYFSTDEEIFSQVYELDLKGATAGGITFTDGITTKTLTYAQLTSIGELQKQLQLWLGAPKVYHTQLSLTNTSYIFGFKFNAASLNLSIVSHTMTGGSGAPILSEPLSYAPPSVKTFDIVNTTTGQTKTISYKTRMGFLWETTTAAHTGEIQMPTSWWESGMFSGITRYGFKQCYGIVNGSSGSSQVVTVPFTTASGSYEKKLTMAAGTLGTGEKILNSFHTQWDGGIWNIFELDQTISVQDYEEFTFTFKFNFGSYTP